MDVVSFARGIPAPECLPVADLADCAKAAVDRDGEVVLSYGSTLGYGPLREWLDRHWDRALESFKQVVEAEEE